MKIYKFFASWCMPCKVLSKNLEGFEREGWELVEIDADTNLEKMKEFGVRKLPTMVIVNEEGETLERFLGVMSLTELQEKLNDFDKR